MVDTATDHETAHELIALRHFVTQFATTIFASLGQSREEFDGFAKHTRDALGITDRSAPESAAAEAALPEVLARLDRLMAEVRRQIPG